MLSNKDLKIKTDEKRAYFKGTLRTIMENEFIPYLLEHREFNQALERAMQKNERKLDVFLTTRTPAVLTLWIRMKDMINATSYKMGFFKPKQVKYLDVDLKTFIDELPHIDHAETFIEEILLESSLLKEMKIEFENKGYNISFNRKTVESKLAKVDVPCLTISW